MIPLRDNIPSRKFPFFNYFLIFANAIIFLYEVFLPSYKLSALIQGSGFKPLLFFKDPFSQYKTLITSMFLHGGWLHFIGNMLYLFIFGDNVEDALGHFFYPIFYLLSGICASFLQAVIIHSEVPMIGASGAIAGVLGFYFILFPYAKVLTLIPFWFFWEIVPVPAFLFLGFWFILQFMSGAISIGAGSGVAFFAHIGGFIFGVLVGIYFRRKKRRRLKFYYV